jgi:hypothetical protein
VAKKQPLKGFTARKFDPPKVDGKGKSIDSKGSRGYTQYTEQISKTKVSLKD